MYYYVYFLKHVYVAIYAHLCVKFLFVKYCLRNPCELSHVCVSAISVMVLATLDITDIGIGKHQW
jgi:hypothetical protein